MRKIEEYCGECCDPIMENEGRYRIHGKALHEECFKEKYQSAESILKAADSASFDTRITGVKYGN